MKNSQQLIQVFSWIPFELQGFSLNLMIDLIRSKFQTQVPLTRRQVHLLPARALPVLIRKSNDRKLGKSLRRLQMRTKVSTASWLRCWNHLRTTLSFISFRPWYMQVYIFLHEGGFSWCLQCIKCFPLWPQPLKFVFHLFALMHLFLCFLSKVLWNLLFYQAAASQIRVMYVVLRIEFHTKPCKTFQIQTTNLK